MKKFASIICAIAIMLMSFTVAYATPGDFLYMYDYADVLTQNGESNLDAEIGKLNSLYDIPLVIVTKNGSPGYSSSDYAEIIYSNTESISDLFENKAGFIFVDDFDNNEFMLYTVGKGDSIISKTDKNSIYDDLNSYYDTDDYYNSYLQFVSNIEDYYSAYSNDGATVDENTTVVEGTTVIEDVSAAESTTQSKYDENYDYSAPESNGAYVADAAELLSSDEEAALLKKIEAIKSKYKIDVVIHTTNSIGSKSIQDYADDFYDYNGYGVGENKDGLLFMLNMNNGEEGNRDYYTSTTGSAISALTDYAIKDSDSCINSKVLPLLSKSKYYKAFDTYLDLIDIFFAQAATGTPYDSANPYKTTKDKIETILILEAIVIGIACLVAFFVVKSLKKKMEIAENKKQAYDYLNAGSTVITNSTEAFSHKHINKVKIEKQSSSSSSSGSSTHTSSSGTTHGGGGGKF